VISCNGLIGRGNEADDEDGDVVGGEIRHGVIEEDLTGLLRVLHVSNEVDSFLILSDIPELASEVVRI